MNNTNRQAALKTLVVFAAVAAYLGLVLASKLHLDTSWGKVVYSIAILSVFIPASFAVAILTYFVFETPPTKKKPAPRRPGAPAATNVSAKPPVPRHPATPKAASSRPGTPQAPRRIGVVDDAEQLATTVIDAHILDQTIPLEAVASVEVDEVEEAATAEAVIESIQVEELPFASLSIEVKDGKAVASVVPRG